MKVIEILKLSEKIIDLLQNSCVKMSDVRYIALYDEYREIVSRGGKKTYAVAKLSNKYKISERQVFYIIKRFSKDCKICAVV